MNIRQFHPGIGRKEFEKEIYEMCHEATVYPLPSMFYFEGCTESKLLVNEYPSKLAKRIHQNMESFAMTHEDWNVVVHIDEVGITHVFFGKNDGVIDLPDVFVQPVAGNC